MYENFFFQLQLIEGFNNDVFVSSIISGESLFLQQPSHQTYQRFKVLQNEMDYNYSKLGGAPLLPEIVEDSICVANLHESWYRVQIITHNKETETCLVQFLDYGGYGNISINDLRQIRVDYLSVPFQAIHCVLSNLKPVGK